MFERFTDRARRVLVLAQEEARQLDHGFIGTEHILLGLISEGDGLAAEALERSGVRLQAVRDRALETIGRATSGSTGSPPFTPRAKKVLELALREALQLGHDHIGTEHILLGLIREGEGVGAQVLAGMGIDLEELRDTVVELTRGGRREGPPAAGGGATLGAQTVGRQRARVVTCTFCGLAPPRSGRLIAGGDAFICEQCIRRWARRLEREPEVTIRRHRLQPGMVTPAGPPPEDADAARAQIDIAFAGLGITGGDGRSVPSVERGEALGPTLASAKERGRHVAPNGSDNTVEEVVFVDAGHAAVWFTISVDGRVLLTRHRGDAVLVDGVWKVARSTFCELMAMAGVPCPPDPD